MIQTLCCLDLSYIAFWITISLLILLFRRPPMNTGIMDLRRPLRRRLGGLDFGNEEGFDTFSAFTTSFAFFGQRISFSSLLFEGTFLAAFDGSIFSCSFFGNSVFSSIERILRFLLVAELFLAATLAFNAASSDFACPC